MCGAAAGGKIERPLDWFRVESAHQAAYVLVLASERRLAAEPLRLAQRFEQLLG